MHNLLTIVVEDGTTINERKVSLASSVFFQFFRKFQLSVQFVAILFGPLVLVRKRNDSTKRDRILVKDFLYKIILFKLSVVSLLLSKYHIDGRANMEYVSLALLFSKLRISTGTHFQLCHRTMMRSDGNLRGNVLILFTGRLHFNAIALECE